MPADSGGGTGGYVAPKVAPVVGPSASPKIYWFNGKAYYSLSAYQSAVAASRVVAPAPAPKPTAAPAPKPTAPAVSVDAARLALQRAEDIRQKQELARANARRQLEAAQLAARKALELQRLALAGRESDVARAAKLERDQIFEGKRHAQEVLVAQRRHDALAALQAQIVTMRMQRESKLRQEERGIAQFQGERADQLQQAAEPQFVQPPRRMGSQEFSEGLHRALTPEQQQQKDVVVKAESTGNWSEAIQILEKQSSETGGRYVDEQLFKTVWDHYVVPVQDVDRRFREAIAQAELMFDSKDMKGFRKFVESVEFQELEKQFTDYFGYERTPGSFAAHAEVLAKISDRRERLWTGLLLDPSGKTTSDADINRLIEKAQFESMGNGRPGRFEERPLTYTEQVTDPATGKKGPVLREGLDAYLAREAARQQDRQEQQYRDQMQLLRRQLGGKVADARTRLALNESFGLIPGGKARVKAIVDANSPSLSQELVRNYLRDARAAYELAHSSEDVRGPLLIGRRTSSSSGPQGNLAATDAWLSELKRALLGRDAEAYGIGDVLDTSFGLGDIFRAAQVPWAAISSTVRAYRAEGMPKLWGGRWVAPDYNSPQTDISLPGNPFGTPSDFVGVRQSTFVDPEGKQKYLDYKAGMASPDANVRANAQRAYGIGAFKGNVGWLIEGALDPLNAVAPAAWLNRARLAVATAGGLRELGSLGGLGRALGQLGKDAVSLGRHDLQTSLAKMALAKETGHTATQMLDMKDVDFLDLLEKAKRGRLELKDVDFLQRSLEKPGVDSGQLLNIVQAKLPVIGREFRLESVGAFDQLARIRAVRESFAQSDQAAKVAAELEARHIVAQEASAALERVRVAAGTNIGEGAVVDVAKLAKFETLLARASVTARDYLAVVSRATKSVDILDEIAAAGKIKRATGWRNLGAVPQRTRLLKANLDLQESLVEMQKFEDSFVIRDGTKELAENGEGLVNKHYRELAEYKLENKGDPSGPSFASLRKEVVRRDRRMLESRIRGLQRAMRSAGNETEIARIRLRQIETHKALAGVQFEAAMLDPRSVVMTHGLRNMDRIRGAVRPQRLGQKATTEVERSVEASRSFSNRIGSIEKVKDTPEISESQARAVVTARDRLSEVSGADIADWLRSPGTRRAHFAGQSSGDVLEALERVAEKLGRPLGDISLDDLLVSFYRVNLNSVDKSLYAGAWKAIQARVAAVLKRSGWEGGVDDYIEELGLAHVRRGNGSLMNLDVHELENTAVTKGVVEMRQFKAVGQVRGGPKHSGDAVLRELARPDTSPEVVLKKIEVLRGFDRDIWEYDAARGVVGSEMLHRRNQASWLPKAEALAVKEGISVDDAMLKVRAQWAEKESLREYQEFALDPAKAGWSPEQVLRMFEVQRMNRDRGIVPGLSVTSYENDVMRSSWLKLTGFDYELKERRAAWLQGIPYEMPVGARAVREGEYMAIEGADMRRVFVLAADDPKFDVDVVPFARGRGSVDDLEELAITALDRRTDRALRVAQRGSVEDLAAAAGELSPEQAALRRSTTRSGGRSFAEVAAPAESPVVSHGLLDGPAGLSVEQYEQYVWKNLKSSYAFRGRVFKLLDKSRGLDERYGVMRSDVLLRASAWLRSPPGRELFRRHSVLSSRPMSAAAVSEARWREALVQEQSGLRDSLKEVRDMAGLQSQIRVEKRWLQRIAYQISNLKQKPRSIGSYALDPDLERQMGRFDPQTSKLRVRGTTQVGEFDPALFEGGSTVSAMERLTQLVGGDLNVSVSGMSEWVSVSEVSRLRSLIDDLGIESIDDLLANRKLPKRQYNVGGAGTDPASKWVRSAAAIQGRLGEIRDELKAGYKVRARGRVGFSVAGDASDVGAYIAEGTSNVTLAHEVFHQWWDTLSNAQWVTDISQQIDRLGSAVRSDLWRWIRKGSAPYDPAEFAAEMYALWRIGDSAGSDVLFSWSDLRAGLAASPDPGLIGGPEMLDQLGHVLGDYSPKVAEYLTPRHVLPIGDYQAMRTFWVDNGYWSPQMAALIESGDLGWSAAEERGFVERNWGYTPPWTNRDVMLPLLDNEALRKAAFQDWNMFGPGFEPTVAGLDLSGDALLDSVVAGLGGLKGKRSWAEMRNWAFHRYGDWIGTPGHEGTVILSRMPELMRLEDEYPAWMERVLSESGQEVRSAEWLTARSGLSKRVADVVFEGDAVGRFGMQIDRKLVGLAEIEKLDKVMVSAMRRRLKRLQDAGDLDPGEWLPQEQLRFALDVTNELLADPAWRGLLRGTPVIGAALHIWGQLWRMLVSLQIAFPIMNLVDSFGFKRLYLQVYENGFRPLSMDADGRRLGGSLREAGLESGFLFGLSDDAKPWLRVGDKMLPMNIRGGALIRTVLDSPLQISKFGENRLRLDFWRSVAGRTFRAARRTGMEVDAAEALARHEAGRMVRAFFLTGGDSGFMRALNQLVPFFSYNWNNKRLALRILWEHPAVALWGDRLARVVKDANREAWEKQHPGVPFPEDDPSSSWLWLKIGDDFYTVDLSSFSDWTRAIKSVMVSQNAFDWATEFFRVPHPSQLGMLAALTGGMTPWGHPGSIREMNAWIDLLYYMNGVDHADPKFKRTWFQVGSQMLFFKKFGRITPIKAKLQQYFWFKSLDPKKAYAYLDENPDLQMYFDQLHPEFVKQGRAELDAAYVEWEALNRTLDARIFQYANQPWSTEYRDVKREAYIVRTAFLRDNPALVDSWGVYMSPSEFAALKDKWRLDELSDAWYNWERPTKVGFDSEIAYQRALVDYYDQRESFLDANPALAERLLDGRNAIENAWREHELQWSSILEFQAKLKVRILEEQEKPADDQDREFVSMLYDVRDAAGLVLDAESYAQVYGVVVPGRVGGVLSLGRLSGLIKRVQEMPGFSDFIYGRATPEERADIERNEWYGNGIAAVTAKATDGKSFYAGLFANPSLLQEYWRRNPDAKARYQAGQEYFRWVSSWVKKLQADDFASAQAVWDAMPGWVRQRYLSGHPDSGMADGVSGGTSTAVQYKGQWFKSPASRDRYIAYVEGGGQPGSFPEGFASANGSGNFRSPETRAAFIRGQEYYAAIGNWVALLKAKDFVAADRLFRAMPEWMREKYYAKHPEQRAQHELDSGVLRKGAEYFLASGDDKLAILAKYPELRAWLAKYGGEEAGFRGLVTAMYKAIPSSEAWLKRTFRERFPEVFGQEALGVRRLAGVLRDLAENPDMLPFYERALALQSRLFTEQLKLNKVAPDPWTMERKIRARKRSKRRAARMSSHWTLHADMRRPK